MSVRLFHGPGAEFAALEWAVSLGRQIAPPFGREGLKVDAARQIVSLLARSAVGDRQGTLVVGPLDRANRKSCDTLLKSVEEYERLGAIPVLWAEDLAGVPGTIRSRCHAVWVSGSSGLSEDDEESAWGLCEAVLEADVATVQGILQDYKGELEALGKAVAKCLSEKVSEGADPRVLDVWSRLRRELKFERLTSLGFARVFMFSLGESL